MTDAAWAAAGVMLAALFTAIPATIAAVNAVRARRETASPNGMRTAEMTHQTWKQVQEMRERQSDLREYAIEGRERQEEILEVQRQHLEEDDRRFGIVFDALGVQDQE